MNEEAISEEDLMETIKKWHPSERERTQIELLQLQFRSLREVVMSKSERGHWLTLRRRIDFAQQQCGSSMEQAQGFIRDLQKSLAATERECSKRMQKIERECLHRDIQIQSMLDQQILQIVQENKALELGEQDLKPFLQACEAMKENVKGERQALQQLVMRCRLEVEDMRTNSRNRMKQIKKSHEAKMLTLRIRLKQAEKTYSTQLVQLRERREVFQNRILAHIERQIAYH